MGPENSVAGEHEQFYAPTSYSRMDASRAMDSDSDDNLFFNESHITLPPFAGKWSIYPAGSISPESRVGHFACVDSDTQIAYIGYGVHSKGEKLNDVWMLNLNTYEWKQLILSNPRPPRSGCRACICGNYIAVFGGFSDAIYMNDLHFINLETGEVVVPVTSGTPPEARSTPVIAVYGHKLFIWGGYNGQHPVSCLSVLDTETMTWQHFPQDLPGRTALPWITVKNHCLCYGNSPKDVNFVDIDMEKNTLSLIPTCGTLPPQVMSAGMVMVGEYIFHIGGKTQSYTLVYALNMRVKEWFVFPVLPDGESVTQTDGSISPNGYFMLPQLSNFGIAYSKRNRQILAYLGAPDRDPPDLFVLSIGNALSCLHLRDDMLNVLNKG